MLTKSHTVWFFVAVCIVAGCSRNESAAGKRNQHAVQENNVPHPSEQQLATLKYIVLQDREFANEYQKAFQKQNFATEADKDRFRDEVFAVQGAVENALKAKWQKETDFEVGRDYNYCYHTCGGIYSDKVFSKEYVATVHNALQSVDPNGLWTYHTVCEIVVNPEGKTIAESTEDRGEFFVRGDTCYVNGSRMKAEWRARLGCPN